jgi:hypothetical protein
MKTTHALVRLLSLFCLLILLSQFNIIAAQNIIYVNENASGGNNGTSWNDAHRFLQDAFSTAIAGDRVWVAKGSYRPDEGAGQIEGNRSETFRLSPGVRVFGGFEGSESELVSRKAEQFKTFLTGDLRDNDQPGFAFRDDNSYHVVDGSDSDASSLLDGFYIKGGNADGAAADSVGGGLLLLNASPAIFNTTFLSNSAKCGGGLYISSGSPELINDVFNGNNAIAGGAICNVNSNPTVINSTIVDNFADKGAGIYNLDSSPVIANTILARNVSSANMLECQRAGYPCTFSEMAPGIIEQSTALSDEVRNHMESGSLETALQWLRSQPDVVFAEGSETSILFRIKGGPQTWVLGQAILDGTPAPGKSAPRMKRSMGVSEASNAVDFIDVVGEDTNSDGKRNNRDKKIALLLSPFRFDFDPWYEGP